MISASYKSHVQSLAAGQASVAGLTQRVGVNFFPQSDVIHAGNRIVLIAAGNTGPDGPVGASFFFGFPCGDTASLFPSKAPPQEGFQASPRDGGKIIADHPNP